MKGEAVTPPSDSSAPASNGSATPAEDSSMVQPGGCPGCPPDQQGSDLLGAPPAVPGAGGRVAAAGTDRPGAVRPVPGSPGTGRIRVAPACS
jgi:hypothetical protein